MTKIVARHFTSKLAFSEGWRFGGFWRSAVGNSALSATAASLSGTHFELDFEHFLRLRLENFSHFELASPSTYSFCCTFHTWNLSFLLQSEHHDGEFSVFSLACNPRNPVPQPENPHRNSESHKTLNFNFSCSLFFSPRSRRNFAAFGFRPRTKRNEKKRTENRHSREAPPK